MKDRIKKIMDSQEMSQKEFADYVGIAAASLSSILNDKGKPTIATVTAIREKFPEINIEWLMYGEGRMYKYENNDEQKSAVSGDLFGELSASGQKDLFSALEEPQQNTRVKNESGGRVMEFVPKREIKEIRIFFDDGTYETFTKS